jgi:hypothetical protein
MREDLPVVEWSCMASVHDREVVVSRLMLLRAVCPLGCGMSWPPIAGR